MDIKPDKDLVARVLEKVMKDMPEVKIERTDAPPSILSPEYLKRMEREILEPPRILMPVIIPDDHPTMKNPDWESLARRLRRKRK